MNNTQEVQSFVIIFVDELQKKQEGLKKSDPAGFLNNILETAKNIVETEKNKKRNPITKPLDIENMLAENEVDNDSERNGLKKDVDNALKQLDEKETIVESEIDRNLERLQRSVEALDPNTSDNSTASETSDDDF